MVQAVIFDMDGVLCDSEPLYYQAMNEVIAHTGGRITEEEYQSILGFTIEGAWEWVMDRFKLPGTLDGWLQRYDIVVRQTLQRAVVPTAGLLELLPRLQAAGLGLGVASSSYLPWIESVLAGLGAARYFPVVVSGSDVQHGKPAPDIYLLAARRLGVNPDACLVFEDSPTGIKAAHSAGMTVVAIVTPYTDGMDLSLARVRIRSFNEFDPASLGVPLRLPAPQRPVGP